MTVQCRMEIGHNTICCALKQGMCISALLNRRLCSYWSLPSLNACASPFLYMWINWLKYNTGKTVEKALIEQNRGKDCQLHRTPSVCRSLIRHSGTGRRPQRPQHTHTQTETSVRAASPHGNTSTARRACTAILLVHSVHTHLDSFWVEFVSRRLRETVKKEAHKRRGEIKKTAKLVLCHSRHRVSQSFSRSFRQLTLW